MFQLHLQYQGAGAAAEQFGNLNAFGGEAGGGVPVANDVVAQFGNPFGRAVEGDVPNDEGLFLEPFHR